MRSFGGLLGAAIVGVVVAVAAGGRSRSELDDELLSPQQEGGSPDSGGPDVQEDVPDGFVMQEGAPPPSCGNGMCDNGETCATCALDCGTCQTCGDGQCQAPMESCTNCPMDCGDCISCGDGFCTMPQENCQNCAVDCGVCPGCGDGQCTPPNETCFSCPGDCGKCMGCGDGLCSGSETCASCEQDCGPCNVCGNNKCEMPYETCINCPSDCGMCPVHTCLQSVECAVGCIGGLGGGGGFNLDAGVPLTCIADCIAQGCASSQYFAQQAVDCIIGALFSGQCMGLSITCLMNACSSQFGACIANHC